MANRFQKYATEPAAPPSNRFAGFAESAAPVAPPPLTAGETAMDAAKSLGIGAVEGGLGLLTLPGNVEQLARLGVNKGAEALGYQPPVSLNAVLPTYNDAKSLAEGVTGPFYEPKSTVGEYARTIGQFAPMAVAPGGLAARAANVLGPALASETAGQLTKGTSYEPLARGAAALAGGMAPVGAMRVVSPLARDAGRAAQVARLQNEGVDALTAGQQTGNRAVRWAEAAAADLPFNGGRGHAMNTLAGEQFTRAALRRAGINADRATSDVIDTGFRSLGQRFDRLALRSHVQPDTRFAGDLGRARAEYHSLVPPSARIGAVENTFDDLAAFGAQRPISGQAYQAIRSRVDRQARSLRYRDPQAAAALTDIREALDGAMQRASPPAIRQEWQHLRGQYRNLLAIEKAMGGAGENTALGLISPSQLRTAVKLQNQRAYVRGQRDLGELARAGEAIMKPLPNSGTPARLAFQHVLSGIGAAGGAGIGGVPGAVAGAFVPAVGQGLLARTLMSRPMQAYLANRAAVPALDAYNAGRVELTQPLGYGYRLPQAIAETAQDRSLHGRQTRGAYPPGDPRWLQAE